MPPGRAVSKMLVASCIFRLGSSPSMQNTDKFSQGKMLFHIRIINWYYKWLNLLSIIKNYILELF